MDPRKILRHSFYQKAGELMSLSDRVLEYLSRNPDKRYTAEALANEMGVHDSWGMSDTLQKLARGQKISQVAIVLEDGNTWGYRTLNSTYKEIVVL